MKSDFFRDDQWQWFQEFVDHEVSEILGSTTTHDEISEFDDLPF